MCTFFKFANYKIMSSHMEVPRMPLWIIEINCPWLMNCPMFSCVHSRAGGSLHTSINLLLYPSLHFSLYTSPWIEYNSHFCHYSPYSLILSLALGSVISPKSGYKICVSLNGKNPEVTTLLIFCNACVHSLSLLTIKL